MKTMSQARKRRTCSVFLIQIHRSWLHRKAGHMLILVSLPLLIFALSACNVFGSDERAVIRRHPVSNSASNVHANACPGNAARKHAG